MDYFQMNINILPLNCMKLIIIDWSPNGPSFVFYKE